MSEPTLPDPSLETPTEPVVSEVIDPSIPEGYNPNWKPFLEVLPTSLYPTVEPVLREWDKGVQDRFQEIHSTYDPFKTFIDDGVDPEVLRNGLALLQRLDQDPKSVVEAIIENWKIDLGQGTPGGETPNSLGDEYSEEIADDPRMKALEEGFQQLAEIILTERQQQENAEGEKLLDEEIKKAKATYGEFDEQLILPAVGNGMTVDEAAKRFTDSVKAAATSSQRPAPQILGGSSGGIPTQAISPKDLDEKATRDLVADMLRQAASTES